MNNNDASSARKGSASERVKGPNSPLRRVVGLISNNFWIKIISLLLAILLWNYVISTDTSITRAKTLYNLTGYISGQSALTSNKLALIEDPTKALSGISVTVQVPQANYSKLSSDNVQVSLDLSSVRSVGTQEVPLRAVSSMGRVQSISPASLTLTFESLDSRNVAVNVVTTGASDDYWYNVTRTNPSVLTVSGAASVVQSIALARVNVDVSDMVSSNISTRPYVLMDSQGNEISQTMLNCSTSSISVSLEVYPCREIPVSSDRDRIVTGQPAQGYVLQSVSVQPESIIVAAESELLEGLTELVIDPVSIEGATQSFSVRTSVSQLASFKNISSEQVYVNVTIAEEVIDSFVDNVKVLVIGKADNLIASYEQVSVYVTGPRSDVEQLQTDGLTLTVDVSEYGEGTYMLTPVVDEQRYPELTIQCESVSVTLTAVAQEDSAG